ncbi:MAG: hypothetical protein JRG90_04780, partial [Deltaproteobacteria bacterium]|nr:hypothetical protein [Deltaproteobacteria bacterium]
MNRISTRIPLLIAALAFATPAGASDPILRADIDVNGLPLSGSERGHDMIDLIEDVIELKGI